MFLTPEQLIQLTGRRTRPAQRRALNQMGIIHEVRPDGFPVVMQAHIEQKMGGAPARASTHEPDWSSLR